MNTYRLIMSFALLDVGGSFAKAVIISSEEEFRHYPRELIQRVPMPGFLEVGSTSREIDPEQLMDVVHRALELARNARPIGDQLSGVFVTGQMAGLAQIDEHGEAQGPLISWQDQRGSAIDAFRQSLSEVDRESLGEGVRVGLPALTLRTLTISPQGFLTSLLGFVAGRLAGVRAPFLHSTDAASWGLVDLREGDWHPEALDFSGVLLSMLPEISWQIRPIGTSELFGCPVWCAVGDQQAALFGVGLAADEVSVNLATGCQVSIRTDQLEFHRGLQTRPFFDSDFLLTKTHLPAGRLLRQAIEDVYGGESEETWRRAHEDFDRAAAAPAVSDAVAVVSEAITDALFLIDPKGLKRLVWSGGVAERFPPIRRAVDVQHSRITRVSNAPEAALMGLAQLVSQT